MLDRLKSAKSVYQINKWESEFSQIQELKQRMKANANRYNRSSYFVHSVLAGSASDLGSRMQRC
jgi:hypothetical protein